MRKTILWSLKALTVIAVIITAAVACSKDDESSLVGTWSGYDKDDDEISITFNSDGTGVERWDDGDFERFEYETDGNTLYMYFGDEYETYRYTISGSTLTLRYLGENGRDYRSYTITLTKGSSSGSGSSAEKVIGTWSYRDGSDQLTLTFTSGGTGRWTERFYDSYSGTVSESGTFTYEMAGAREGIIILRDGNRSETIYFEIDGSKMYIYEDEDHDEFMFALTKQ